MTVYRDVFKRTIVIIFPDSGTPNKDIYLQNLLTSVKIYTYFSIYKSKDYFDFILLFIFTQFHSVLKRR